MPKSVGYPRDQRGSSRDSRATRAKKGSNKKSSSSAPPRRRKKKRRG